MHLLTHSCTPSLSLTLTHSHTHSHTSALTHALTHILPHSQTPSLTLSSGIQFNPASMWFSEGIAGIPSNLLEDVVKCYDEMKEYCKVLYFSLLHVYCTLLLSTVLLCNTVYHTVLRTRYCILIYVLYSIYLIVTINYAY